MAILLMLILMAATAETESREPQVNQTEASWHSALPWYTTGFE